MNVFSVTPGSDWSLVERNAMAGLPDGGFLGISDDETGGLYGYRIESGGLLAGIFYFDISTREVVPTKHSNALELIAAVGLRHRTQGH